MPITLAISSSEASLRGGQTADITFAFSQAPVGFTIGDITISGGTLSGLAATADPLVYIATFSPNAGLAAGVGSVSVASGVYSNTLGELGSGAAMPTISIDSLAPTMSITSSASSLRAGESATITFTFSEAPVTFTVADLTATNGTLSGFTVTSNPLVYTAAFTPTAGLGGASGEVSLASGSYFDAAGNTGTGGASPAITLDTVGPTVAISASQATLHAGETARITFSFSEEPVGFGSDDLTVTGGTLSPLQATGNPLVYEATFTPTAGVTSGSATISVGAGSYTDPAGNPGLGSTSPSLLIQTVRPTATIALSDVALKPGDTSDVTFIFSEAVTGFTSADVTVENGVLSGLSSSNGGVTWTATLTPAGGVTDATNLVSLDMAGVMNAVGNAGTGTVPSANYVIDSTPPTAAIAIANAAMQAGQTSLVTITFSETVTGFANADLSVENGALSNVASSDGGRTWTATLTPTGGVVDATNVITLDLAGVMDGVGNTGVGVVTSPSYQVGYVPPAPPSEDDVLTMPAGGGEVAAGPGSDSVNGGAGSDVIQGNAGDDSLSGGGGGDMVRGGQDDDFVQGNTGSDLLFGDLGDDSVFGGQGDDFVQGGAGSDYVVGDLGRDTVVGGQGGDTAVGGAGDDYLSGDLGDDVLVGGSGADLFNFNGGGGRDVVMDFSRVEGDHIRISPADASSFAELATKFGDDHGNAVIALSGQTIILVGVSAGSLTAADFVFG